MKKELDIIRGSRSFIMNLIEGISIDKMNKIPAGFNNNLIWNFGHVIATQQKLCYVNLGVKPLMEDFMIQKYQSGSRPAHFIDESEFDLLKEYLFSTINQFEKDAENHLFDNFKLIELKSYNGLRIETIEDAIKFDCFHEGLHVGSSMALKRLVNNG